MRLRPNFSVFRVPLETSSQRWNYVNSTIEGSLAVAAIQSVASFVIVYAMELGATNSQVGLMVSLPFLANAIIILAGGRFIAGRKEILRPTCFVSAMHRVFVVLMLAAPFLPQVARVWWVLITYSLATASAALTSTWWSAMMSDIYPRQHRGAVFGTRSMIAGSAGVVATLMMGQGLDFLPFPINFISMFLLAAITGFIAVRFLAKTRLPKPESSAINATDLQVISRPRWREVLRGNTGVAFARLAIPVFLFNIGFHLAAPVVNIYYVEYMHLSKGSIGLLSAAFLVFQVLSSRFWGRMGDRLGNHVVAFISMAILIVQAALYSLVPSLPFILIMQIIGGFAFGGYAMSTFNSIIALGTPSNRPVVISLFNVVGGLGGFLSPSAGTAVLDHYGLLAAFLLAAVLRTLGTLSMGVPARTEWKQGGISRLLYLRHFGVLAFTGRRKAHTAKHGGGVYRTTKSSSTVAASPSE